MKGKIDKRKVKHVYGTLSNFAHVFNINYNTLRRWIHTGVSIDTYIRYKIPLKYVSKDLIETKKVKKEENYQDNKYYYLDREKVIYKHKSYSNFIKVYSCSIHTVQTLVSRGAVGKTYKKYNIPYNLVRKDTNIPVEKLAIKVRDNNGGKSL